MLELEELGAGVLELDGRVLELLEELLEELGVGVLELDDSGAPPQAVRRMRDDARTSNFLVFMFSPFCFVQIDQGFRWSFS